MPSELALSLSTTSVACVALICRSLLTSAKRGSRAHRVRHLLRPVVELRPVEALHDELVFGPARSAADAQVLHRHREGADAGDARGVAAQIGQHLLQRRALAPRLELDEHAAGVERACRRRSTRRWRRAASCGRRRPPAAAARPWPRTRCPGAPRSKPRAARCPPAGKSPWASRSAARPCRRAWRRTRPA